MLRRDFCKLVLFSVLAPSSSASGKNSPDYVLSFSGDGQYLLCHSGAKAWVYQVSPRKRIFYTNGVAESDWLRLSSTGRWLAICSPDGGLRMLECATGVQEWNSRDAEFTGVLDWVPGVVFSPDDSLVLFITHTGARLLECGTGTKRHAWMWDEDSLWISSAFSADGKVVFHAGPAGVTAYSVATGKVLAKFPTEQEALMILARPRLIEAVFRGGVIRIKYPEMTSTVSSFAPQQNPFGPLRWQRESGIVQVYHGSKLVYKGTAAEKVGSWNREGGFLISSGSPGKPLAFYSDSGRRIPGGEAALGNVIGTPCGYVERDGTVTCYDLRNGRALGTLTSTAIANRSDTGGKLAVATPKGIVIVDALASVRAQKLVLIGKPILL